MVEGVERKFFSVFETAIAGAHRYRTERLFRAMYLYFDHCFISFRMVVELETEGKKAQRRKRVFVRASCEHHNPHLDLKRRYLLPWLKRCSRNHAVSEDREVIEVKRVNAGHC